MPTGGSLLLSQSTEPAPTARRQSCLGNGNASEARHNVRLCFEPVPARLGPGLAARGSGSGVRWLGMAVPGGGLAGAWCDREQREWHESRRARGGCVYASACLYRKEPTCSFRFQTSLISRAVPATLGRGGSQRQPTLLPLPRQPGDPHLGTEPTTLPTASAVAPAAPGEKVGCAGCGCSALAVWPMTGVREGPGGWRKSPPGLERRGWRCWRGLRCAGEASESGFAGGQLLRGQGLMRRGACGCSPGHQHGGGICTVPTGEQRISPGTAMGMARRKAQLRSPRG